MFRPINVVFCAQSVSSSKLARQLIATRLTQRNTPEVKGSGVPGVKYPKLEHVCSGCGKAINRERTHCADCAIDGATERLVDAARIGRVAATQSRSSCETCGLAATARTGMLGVGRIKPARLAYQ